MNGKFQGQDEIVIKASPETIWEILIDGSQLSSWMPIVQQTTSEVERLHQVRSCEVDMNGKTGKVEEQCTLFDKAKEIGWEMTYDEFGFSRMFANYGFSFELVPLGNGRTRVINRGFYDPKNLLVSVLNVVMMKRQSSKVRQIGLKGLQTLAENGA